MQQVTSTITLDSLRQDVNRSVGQTVLLGGEIIDTQNTANSTTFIVLGHRLDAKQKPVSSNESPGRFIVQQPSFLDPAIYRPGRKITVAGTVRGHQIHPLGETTYDYPLIENRELYLWPEEGSPFQQPAVRFGVGVGISF
jgi:outer membrane lipoprotein